MSDVLLISVAFGLGLALSFCVRKPKPKASDFDGGFRHDNEIRVTRIMSHYAHPVKGD